MSTTSAIETTLQSVDDEEEEDDDDVDDAFLNFDVVDESSYDPHDSAIASSGSLSSNAV